MAKTKTERAVEVISRILLSQYQDVDLTKTNPSLAALIEELGELSLDGRASSWDEDRINRHGELIRQAHSEKRTKQPFFLKRGGNITELKGWDSAAKAVGIKESSLRTKISAGAGLATFAKHGDTWVLGKTLRQVENHGFEKFHETGNPDDIVEVRKIIRPNPGLLKKKPTK